MDHGERARSPAGAIVAARVDNESVLPYTLDGIARGVPETLYFRFPLDVPFSSIREYPIRGRVIAEGADGEARSSTPCV